MDEGTFESIRDVIGSFFQQQDHVNSSRIDESDYEPQEKEVASQHLSETQLDDSVTGHETLRDSPCFNSDERQIVELETANEITELLEPVEELSPTKDSEKWMQESSRQALGALRHSSSLLMYQTYECRIVSNKPPKSAESLQSNHSVQALNVYPYSVTDVLSIEQDVSKPSCALEEMTSVFAQPSAEDYFVADHELLGNVDELPSKEFDELQGNLPDILPELNGIADLDLHETSSSQRNSKTNPSSSTSRKSASSYESGSVFSTSMIATNSVRQSFSPQLPNLNTQSTFLAGIEPMFKPLEELPPPYCY